MKRGGNTAIVIVSVVVALVGASCTSASPSGPGPIGADCQNPPVIRAGARLYNCTVAVLDVGGVDLSGGDLRGSDLSDTNLSGANLTNASITYPEVVDAVFDGATLAGFVSQAQQQPGLFFNIDFTTADWSGATFSGPHQYTGSTCPDGTVAGSGDSCF